MNTHPTQVFVATEDSDILDGCRAVVSCLDHPVRVRPISGPAALPVGAAATDWLVIDDRLHGAAAEAWTTREREFAGGVVRLVGARPLEASALPETERTVLIDRDDVRWIERLTDVMRGAMLASASVSDRTMHERRRAVTRGAAPAPPPLATRPSDSSLSLLQLASRLHALSTDALVDVVFDELVPALGATRASLYGAEPEHRCLRLRRHTHSYDIDHVVDLDDGDGPMACAARAATCVVARDWNAVPPPDAPSRPYAERYRTTSSAVLPLVAADRLWAVLNLADREAGSVFDPSNDGPTLTGWAGLLGRAWANAVAFEDATRRADTDSLTGLLNARRFHEHLEHEVARAQRYGGALSLIVLDVNGLEHVNRTHGRTAGDRALAAVAACIVRAIRKSDQAFRIGGDEFAVVVTGAGQDAADAVATRICHAVRGQRIAASADGTEINLSVGTGRLAPAMEARDLLASAEASLYRRAQTTPSRHCSSYPPEERERQAPIHSRTRRAAREH